MAEDIPLTCEQCDKIFNYLEGTAHGQNLIQDNLKAIEEWHGTPKISKNPPQKPQKFQRTKPNEMLDRFKPIIFYHYMQPGNSSKKIREAMTNVDGFDMTKIK
jgi:hypothetical protein